MHQGFVTTSDGVRLHVESRGEGPPVLFVAGYTATAASWALQRDAVVQAGYRAVCVDRRWHGRSDRPAHGHRIARHAADICEVAAALGLERPVYVGASMGASVGWSYLDLFGPGALSAVVSVDQTPCMVNKAGWPYGFYGLDEDNLGRFFAQGVPTTGRGRPAEASAGALGELQARTPGEPLSHPIGPDTRPLLDDHARQDWRDLIAATSTPLLFIAGRDSQLWPCDHAEAAARTAQHGSAAIIENAGHLTNIDQHGIFNTTLLQFIGQLHEGRRSGGRASS